MKLLNPLRNIPAEHCEATDALSFARVAGYIGEDDEFPVSKSDHPIHWPVARFSQELWDTAHALGESKGMISTSSLVQNKHEQMVSELEEVRADATEKQVRIDNLTEAMETTIRNCNEQITLLAAEKDEILKKQQAEIKTHLEQIEFQNHVIDRFEVERDRSIKHRVANAVRFLVDLVDDPR